MKTLLFISILFASCNLAELVAPIDFVPTEPAIIECEGLQEITSPQFITGYIQFDSIPSSLKWLWGNTPTTLEAHFNDFKLYQEGRNVAVIIKGTNNTSAWNGKIFIRDGNNKKYGLNFSRQSLSMGGACTYSELKQLQTEFKSVYWLNYKNMFLDSLQYDTLISFQVDSFCKEGRERIDLRGIPIAQSRIDQCFEVGWNNVWFN